MGRSGEALHLGSVGRRRMRVGGAAVLVASLVQQGPAHLPLALPELSFALCGPQAQLDEVVKPILDG